MSTAPATTARSGRRTAIAVAVVALLGLAAVTAPSHADTATPTKPLLGVYDGNQGWAMTEVAHLEAWQGRPNAVVELFTSWDGNRKVMDNLFGQQLPAIWANGNVPLITWEPFVGATTPADIEVRIAAGAYDAYVRTWASRLGAFLDGPDKIRGNADDRRAYLRLAHEVNGDWYPWSAVGGGTPADYQAMWQRVHRLAKDAGGFTPSRVQWVWAVNHTDVGSYTAEQYWPGADVVDWVAIDGYNWGASQTWSSWQTPELTLGPMLARLRALAPGTPVSISEVASTSVAAGGVVDLQAKSEFIRQLATWAPANGVGMLVWFNEDKETDWAVFGGTRGDGTHKVGRTTYKTFGAYRTSIGASDAFTRAIRTDPRRITDDQFAGRV